MSKPESTFKNMVISLFLVTFISSATLGMVYELTRVPIEEAAIKTKNEAISKVITGFDNDPFHQRFNIPSDLDSLVFYPARKDGKLIGIAAETYSMNGFSGLIRLMVGFTMDGEITSVAVLDHQETPGLGDKIQPDKSDFPLQFQGKNPADFKLRVRKDNGDVDAITASTISSRAYSEAIERAYESFMNYKSGITE